MKKTIELLKSGFESSSGLTAEFAAFYKIFKKEFTAELKKVGAADIVFKRGHFYVNGFCTVDGKPWYFSLSDVRGMEYNHNAMRIMYRTARDYKDYTGGQNRFATIEPDMGEKMFWSFKVVS